MKRAISLVMSIVFVAAMMSGVAFSDEKGAVMQDQEKMITGTINDANQLVDKDGQIFNVADTEPGNELVTHVGQKVQVKGAVMEKEGMKQISVSAYKIIKE